jgi:hypothetical protein
MKGQKVFCMDAGSEEPLVLQVLPFCSRQMGLQGLACLAACSKKAKLTSDEIKSKDALIVLLGTLDATKAEAAAESAAGAIQRSFDKQLTRLAAWWKPVQKHVQTVPTALTLAGVSDRMLWLPPVSLKQAKQLISGGVRIRYAELLTAASCMVPGLAMWVQAQQQLGIQTDIPKAAVEVCTNGTVWVS